MRKKSRNVHKIEGAHLKYVNNYYESLNKKECKPFRFKITQNRHPLSILDGKKCLSSRPLKNEKKNMKCAQNKRGTSSICTQPLCQV